MSEHSDVIIVGAGPGGLSCAMLLAKAGVKVTILEKTGEVGGRTKVFEKDGYKFDNGPTFFHYPEIAEDGLVIRTHPQVKLIAEMGPSLAEFRDGLDMEW